MSIIKRIRSVCHFGRTFALFTDKCKVIPQSYTLKSIWDSPVWSVRTQSCTVGYAQNTWCINTSMWKTVFFLLLLQINMRGHGKCISLVKHGPPALIKLEFLISSTSFSLKRANKMSCHEKTAKWCSHVHITNTHMGNEKLFFLWSHCFCT